MPNITFDLRSENGLISSTNPTEIWKDWKGANECWMFVSAHDDDIVCGAGLTLLAALHNKINVACVVASDGRMGYCRAEMKDKIAAVRRAETITSFQSLGVAQDRLFLFDYPDAGLELHVGKRFSDDTNDPTRIAGATGLQNSFTWVLRKIRPNRVFLPVHTDLHPDHKTVHYEFLISCFHAQGNIWPELGEPIADVPNLYEYATYSDYSSPPNIRIRSSSELLEQKLAGIAAYKSQEQIELIVAGIRNNGPQEYVREMQFDIIQPKKYEAMFLPKIGKMRNSC